MIVNVRMAEWKTARSPDSLKTSGLGSCVAVVLYDPFKKIAAMAHVMLPWSGVPAVPVASKGKYANTAISHMVAVLCQEGANKSRLMAKIAGGAQMFGFQSHTPTLSIGARNTEACEKTLAEHRIPIVMQDTGGTSGRTVEFFCEDDRMTIKTVSKGVKVL